MKRQTQQIAPYRPRKIYRGNEGRVVIKMAVILTLLLAALSSLYYLFYQIKLSDKCSSHLRKLYHALELYELERGTLPELAFFPNDPKQDRDSIFVVLEPYGATPAICLCPTAHLSQKELGLTYVWNVKLNGKKLAHDGDPIWMLVELNALSVDVPAPHLRHYNALFTDGKVRKIELPLRELPGL